MLPRCNTLNYLTRTSRKPASGVYVNIPVWKNFHFAFFGQIHENQFLNFLKGDMDSILCCIFKNKYENDLNPKSQNHTFAGCLHSWSFLGDRRNGIYISYCCWFLVFANMYSLKWLHYLSELFLWYQHMQARSSWWTDLQSSVRPSV